VSSNIVFRRLDAATAPEYWLEVTTEGKCRQQDYPDARSDAGSADADVAAAPVDAFGIASDARGRAADTAAASPGAIAQGTARPQDHANATVAHVAVIAQGSVGPYDYANIKVDPTAGDATEAATEWFALKGYTLTAIDRDGLTQYVRAGLHLLAFKLRSDAEVGAIRPIILTYDGKMPFLPLRAQAGAATALRVWMIGPSQAVPENYKSLVINDALLDWLSAKRYPAGTLPAGGVGPFNASLAGTPSNYDAVVTAAVDEAKGQGFVTELGAPASRYRDKVWSATDDQHFAMVSSKKYADGIDAIVTADPYYRGWDGWMDAVRRATTLPSGVTFEEFYRSPDRYRGVANVDTIELLRLLEKEVVKPVTDTAGMFYRAPYLTRLYRTASSDAIKVDPTFNFNADLALVSNTHIAKQFVQCRPTLNPNDAPWRIQLSRGGVIIGGNQTVKSHSPDAETFSSPKPPGASRCSVSLVGADTRATLRLWWPLVLLLLAGCSRGGGMPPQPEGEASSAPRELTREQLLDPESCKECHPIHYREWSSSMHAYSARDPVFVAMNKRGQRETHGQLGDFCIRCHAPMAVLDKRSKDGLDLEGSPDKERGVSCYFCHNVVSIEGDHNAMLRLANDTTMRGPIRDPLPTRAHRGQYSEMFDETSPNSTAVCGGCHDIVTRTGVHLERTFEEYRIGLFSKSATGAPPSFDSCVGCHMPGQKAYAAVGSVDLRTVHEHLWPGIDVPLTPSPHRDALRSAVEDCQLGLASVSFFTLEVTPPDLFSFQVETKAGHDQPSGAAQDRRMWLEFLAYDEDGTMLESGSSGRIADGEIEERAEGDPKRDPHLLMLRDRIYDEHGKPVHMFWQAGKSSEHPDGYESNVIPVATTSYIDGTHVLFKQYRARGPHGLPARATARLRMRPIGLDVLQDLVDSGDLDPAIMAEMPTFTFGAQLEWTPKEGVMRTVSASPKTDCRTYRCLLDPSSPSCAKAK